MDQDAELKALITINKNNKIQFQKMNNLPNQPKSSSKSKEINNILWQLLIDLSKDTNIMSNYNNNVKINCNFKKQLRSNKNLALFSEIMQL